MAKKEEVVYLVSTKLPKNQVPKEYTITTWEKAKKYFMSDGWRMLSNKEIDAYFGIKEEPKKVEVKKEVESTKEQKK